MAKNILLITGEPSGDVQASKMLKELKIFLPDTHFWGFGGDNLEKQGLELIEHIRDLSIVGIFEIIKKLPQIHSQFKKIRSEIDKREPDAAILIDYPGFNLKLAEYLKKKGIPVIYYIIPQIWAWGPWRINKIKKYVDKAVVLFDFEETLLKNNGIDCTFAGHPLVDSYHSFIGTHSPAERDKKAVALLPGSRNSEIDRLLPPMLEAAHKIHAVNPGIEFIIAESSNIQREKYEKIYSCYGPLPMKRVKDDTLSALENADFALVTSGTATLETSMMEKPMVVAYKTNLLTYFLGRHVFMIAKHLSLANIIADKEIVPELFQNDATGDNLAGTALSIMEDPLKMDRTRNELSKVKASLGDTGASRRAAEAIYEYLAG